MTNKLIIIEGIPGSGKTTFAHKTAQYLHQRGDVVNLYPEGPGHPADLGWSACVPIAQYDELLERYAALGDDVIRNTSTEGEYAVVAYNCVKDAPDGFYAEMEAMEVYDNRAPDELFYGLHQRRWRTFGERAVVANERNVFEHALLQNPVNELVLWRDADDAAVIAYCNRLIGSVEQLAPVVIYLSQPNAEETIMRVARERVSSDGDKWIDFCISYVENTPYGKRHGLSGIDGFMHFIHVRKRLELEIMHQLPVSHVVIENPDYDWDGVWSNITQFLDTLQ